MVTMLNKIAPVVKTLNDAYESSLLADSDNKNIVDSHEGTPVLSKSKKALLAQKTLHR